MADDELRCGDAVRHVPSGQTFMVLRPENDGRVASFRVDTRAPDLCAVQMLPRSELEPLGKPRPGALRRVRPPVRPN